ncbi:MAG: F0F1 ATP synthase subunit gamma [Clostridia bacterium]|nr:F0F1 ATP synthase subunit gamma [Clostridia bacterium]
MPTVQSLKKKLNTIHSTTKLTRAMKTASTVKFAKISGIYAEYEKYAGEYLNLYRNYRSEFNSVFPCTNPDAPCCFVVIASNRGMCGSFNTELFSFFSNIEEKGIIISCGKKAAEYFERKGIETEKNFVFEDMPSQKQVKELFEYICTLMAEGKISSVKTVYPKYTNMIKQKPICRDLFTFDEGKTEAKELVFVPDRDTVIKNTAEKIFLSVLYKRVLETALGAQAATLTTMRSAYDTACEYSAKLETEMNRKRQSQVTADVIEISSEFSMKGDI